jgi:hypothetical protein
MKVAHHTFRSKNIHLIRIEKSPFSGLRKAGTRLKLLFESLKYFLKKASKADCKGQVNKHERRTRKQEMHTCSMNNSVSLSLVQGPSTVPRMIATSLSQLPTDFISSLQ